MNQNSIPTFVVTENKCTDSASRRDTPLMRTSISRLDKKRQRTTGPSPPLNVAELWKVAYDAVRPSAILKEASQKTPKIHEEYTASATETSDAEPSSDGPPRNKKAKRSEPLPDHQHTTEALQTTKLPRTVFFLSDLKEQNALMEQSRNKMVVLFFTAKWCRSCRFIEPVWNKLIQDNPDTVAFTKVDVDTASQSYIDDVHQIRTMPTFVFYRRGEPVHRFTGGDPYLLFCKVNQYK